MFPWCADFVALNAAEFQSSANVRTFPDGRFQSITCIPFCQVQRMVLGCSQTLQLDCMFTTHNLFKGQVMLAVTNDGNNNVVVVAVKMCLSVRTRPSTQLAVQRAPDSSQPCAGCSWFHVSTTR